MLSVYVMSNKTTVICRRIMVALFPIVLLCDIFRLRISVSICIPSPYWQDSICLLMCTAAAAAGGWLGWLSEMVDANAPTVMMNHRLLQLVLIQATELTQM